MNRKDCEHPTLFFNSGDYYLTCLGCGARWATMDTSRQAEYGTDRHGREVGACPEAANIGIEAHFSSDEKRVRVGEGQDN